MGHRLDLAEGAVGSVLAAVGTAMPETMIPFVAIVMSARSGHPHEVGIGIGAILGARMLATLAMLVTGVAVLIRARGRQGDDRLQVEPLVIARDVRHFAVAYMLAIGAAGALLPAPLAAGKVLVAVVLSACT